MLATDEWKQTHKQNCASREYIAAANISSHAVISIKAYNINFNLYRCKSFRYQHSSHHITSYRINCIDLCVTCAMRISLTPPYIIVIYRRKKKTKTYDVMCSLEKPWISVQRIVGIGQTSCGISQSHPSAFLFLNKISVQGMISTNPALKKILAILRKGKYFGEKKNDVFSVNWIEWRHLTSCKQR